MIPLIHYILVPIAGALFGVVFYRVIGTYRTTKGYLFMAMASLLLGFFIIVVAHFYLLRYCKC